MGKYFKADDVIRKRAETLADTSYWEYGNPKNVDEWLEVAEMEFKDLPTINIVHCKDCFWHTNFDGCFFSTSECEDEHFCSWGERNDYVYGERKNNE